MRWRTSQGKIVGKKELADLAIAFSRQKAFFGIQRRIVDPRIYGVRNHLIGRKGS
jgi:hypothetical protein